MSATYRCACFAIPLKMIHRIATRASGEERESMRHHQESTIRMRSERHDTKTHAAPVVGRRGHYRQRRIFDADFGESLPGRLVRDEGARRIRDDAANHVYRNTGIALNFFHRVLGRESIDGCGMRVDSSVHVGQMYANAMWNGSQMIYGDGNSQIGGFAEALDVITHELSHGVTQHAIPRGLGVAKVPREERRHAFERYTLRGEGGALNESFSDIFGSLVKQWHLKQDVKAASWLIGENMLAPEHGKAIRSLKDPGNRRLTWFEDEQVKHMHDFRKSADAHDNSGIPNHAFYLAAREIGGFSWEKAGPIWYRALLGLRHDAGFRDAARATLSCAAAMHGDGSREHKAVGHAWARVGVRP